ncbi:MAG: transporter substrate-binding domain-containing protein [Rhodospirillaceae bacterium]|nr:transporter substrate-binding domain-containing protein [Rhodospirillales bacterium]
MRFKGGLAAFVLGCCMWTMPAQASPRELVVGVEELDYFPAYSVQAGEYVGAARDILDAFAAANGYSLTYKPQPIKRLYAELLSGGIDLKFPDNPQWTTEAKGGQGIVYSNPVINYIDGVLVRPNLAGSGVDAIRTLGTVSGFTPFAWLDRIKDGTVQVKENPRMELLLRQAAIGRFDGAYGSLAVANHILDNVLKTPGALVFDPTLPHSRDSYRLSSRTHPQVVAEFNAWMAANAATVKAIKNRTGAEKGVQ